MTLGFTGTSRGMTQRQRATVAYLFAELQLTVLHHGDCVGADVEAHHEARELYARTVIHPPSDEKARAFCKGSRILEPLPYLVRNRVIVKDGIDGLIAAPRGYVEERRSGTWATVHYARKAGRRVWIVWPDGKISEEEPTH